MYIASIPKPMNISPDQKSSGFLIFSCTIIDLLFKTCRNCRALAASLGLQASLLRAAR
jgi:hypothetical protein